MINYKFGIEIEFAGLQQQQTLCALRAAGIAVQIEGYNHNDHTDGVWKIVTDASVIGGHELVSPVLSGEEGLAEAVKAAHAIEDAGATINKTCGLHVHIDASSFTVGDVYTIYNRYRAFEGEIDAFMPLSRRGNNNRFCRSLGDLGMCPATISALAHAQDSRYYKVNLQAYLRHHTIEFRQHSGTVDAGKIENWVRFLQAFCLASTQRPAGGEVRLQRRQAEMVDFIDECHGATIGMLQQRFSLLPHSARAAISYLRRRGVSVVSQRAGGETWYTINDSEPQAAGPDSLFRGVDASICEFYHNRAAALAA